MPDRAITIRDIARECGMGKSTVARALQEGTPVSPVTREKVHAAAQRLGYVKDAWKGRLMSEIKKSSMTDSGRVVAFVTPHDWESIEKRRNIFINRRYFRGACDRAEELGLQVQKFDLSGKSMTAGRLSRILHSRSVEGVLIGNLLNEKDRSLQLQWSRFNSVCLGYTMGGDIHHRAAPHQFNDIQTALRKIRSMGFRRIMFFCSASLDERIHNYWSAGYRCFNDHIPEMDRLPPCIHELPDNQLTAFLDKWCAEYQPQAIIGVGQKWTQRLSPNLAGSLRLFGLDVFSAHHSLPGIEQNLEGVGAAAVDLLSTRMLTRQIGIPPSPTTVLIEGKWVD